MRLRTFTAPDMQSALKQVREALGDDAIILSSTQDKRKGVSVTAAVEQEDSSDQWSVVSDQKEKPSLAAGHLPLGTESLRFQIQEILRFHNIPEIFIAKIMNADRNAWALKLRECLEKLLSAYFKFEPLYFPTHSDGSITMIVGPPGIGKTLTVARIAARLTMDKQPLMVITTDTKRAGGVEQLQAFTNILGQPLHVAMSRTALAQYLKSAKKHSRILIDTAGCNPYDTAELKELSEFTELEGVDPVLALPAGGDSLEAVDTVEAFMALPIKRLLVTRADTARRFGGVLAAAAAHGLAFCNVSLSSSITEPIKPLDESRLAQLLLSHRG